MATAQGEGPQACLRYVSESRSLTVALGVTAHPETAKPFRAPTGFDDRRRRPLLGTTILATVIALFRPTVGLPKCRTSSGTVSCSWASVPDPPA
jgi:hypothetical protein